LYQALPNKLEKIEYLLQKWTEVGFSGFYFYRAERSQNLNLSENKIERLKKIIIETTEQSERTKIPELVFWDKISFVDLKDDENVFFHLKFSPEMPLPQGEKNDLKSLKIDYKKRVNIFVWPEWGFTETEAKTFELNNFKNINLWSRILRAETVGIVSGFYIIQNK
jgi:16S rRNA (uracil1498-N3)-methyltransferase